MQDVESARGCGSLDMRRCTHRAWLPTYAVPTCAGGLSHVESGNVLSWNTNVKARQERIRPDCDVGTCVLRRRSVRNGRAAWAILCVDSF